MGDPAGRPGTSNMKHGTQPKMADPGGLGLTVARPYKVESVCD